MYENQIVEELYQEKAALWKLDGYKLTPEMFEAEYREEIWYATQKDVS